MITRELNVGRSGIVQFKLASELYTQIMEYIGTEPNDKITQNMTDRLAGHIKKEFNLENIKPKLWEDFTTFFESIDELLSADLQVPIVVSSKSFGLCSTQPLWG